MILVLLCVIDVSKAITPLALLQKELAVTTRLRIAKVPLIGHPILMNPHHIQITSPQLTDITKLLDHIPLCMNREIRKSRALRPRSQSIRGHPENLAPPHKHRNMKADQVRLPHPHSIGVIQELLHQGIITRTNGPGHLRCFWGMGVRAGQRTCGSILPYGQSYILSSL